MTTKTDNNPTRMTTTALIDQRGALVAQIADMQAQVALVDVVLRKRIAAGTTTEGELFSAAHIVTAPGRTLDKDTIKEEMGEAWVDDHSKDTASKDYIKSNARMRNPKQTCAA